jgi:hypothetical protein
MVNAGVRAAVLDANRAVRAPFSRCLRFSAGRRVFFSQVYHTRNAKVPLATAAEIRTMDVIYLLVLAGLYLVSHGLVWALNRLGMTS